MPKALKSYTLDAAHAAFEETLKGSLTPGKLADIVVLSHDILRCPEADIPKTEVIYTIVGGRIAFSRLRPRTKRAEEDEQDTDWLTSRQKR